MGIDGTWRRSCVLKAISAVDAELTLDGSLEGLNLKEFFLLLSSAGLAYRRCELVRASERRRHGYPALDDQEQSK
jgi:hypothetical protein